MNIKNLVKDNYVTFDSYRQGTFYYRIAYLAKGVNVEQEIPYGTEFIFPVPVDDIGRATLLSKDKAITYMRWIRKAMSHNTLSKTGTLRDVE
jgi:hypothetical protein